ncbi:hypothetical protein G7Y79_00032g066600 [Physcia stellaris]|nr:hypothetical protein G7Y79_00032g066600 [Physcia stellaris]
MASASSSKKVAAPKMPQSHLFESGHMSYAVKGADLVLDESWVSLETVAGLPKDANVGPVEFDYNIKICQKTKTAKCTLELGPQQYTDPMVTPGAQAFDSVRVIFKCTGPHNLQLEGDAARELPLAKLCGDALAFEHVRLAVLFRKIKPKNSDVPKVIIGQLRTFLTGNVTLDIQNPWNTILTTDRNALWAESEAQQSQLGLFKDCVIKTKAGRRNKSVIVEVFPAASKVTQKDDEVTPVDHDKKVGLSYWIKNAPSLFPTDDETMAKHKVFGTRTEGWELVVIRNIENSPALMVGTISNTFSQGGIQAFINREESGRTSTWGHGQLRRSPRRGLQKLKGFFVDPNKERPRTQLPAYTLFSNLKCNEEENQLELVVKSDIPADIRDKLNDTQLDALVQALGHKASVCQGPPGTGKSTFVAAATRHLVVNKGEKLAEVAMANVAVDELLHSAVKMWRRFDSEGKIPFARIYSESQIQSQWAADETDLLNSPYHIDQLRFQLAQSNRSKWQAYLAGRNQLMTDGVISSEDLYKGYSREAVALSHEVLDSNEVQVVFCTVASCQTPNLYKETPETKTIQWFFKATTVFLDEAGTAQRPNMMMLVMAFPSAKRFAMAGDPLQFPALVLNQETRKLWPSSYLQDIMNRKFPTVMLGVQYRMHDQLYQHLIDCVYKFPIHSPYMTSNPSPFLQRLLSQTIRVNTSRDEYHLSSFLHFLDVAEGKHESIEGGSSWNLAEVEAVNALVKAFLQIGILKSEICVMTGYARQLKLLQASAKANNWSDIKRILTIDSSQGAEFKIVIISLVRTHGRPGFLGQRPRANVGTSRQAEGMYFVGQEQYWFSPPRWSKQYMHEILGSMKKRAAETHRPPFVVTSERLRQRTVASTSAPPLPSSDNSPQPQALINRPAGVISSEEHQAQLARVKSEEEECIREKKEAQASRRARTMQELDANDAQEIEAIKAEFAEKRVGIEEEFAFHKLSE